MSDITPPRVLTIAGSDSGGGAGIQADLKTFAALGVYGLSAVTAITAQNTRGVSRTEAVSAKMVGAQMEAVVTDIGVDAVKIGMVWSVETIRAVGEFLKRHKFAHVVVDPVLETSSGQPLLEEAGFRPYVENIVPEATVLTPNIAEAERLADMRIGDSGDVERAAELIYGLGPRSVLVKGGHLEGSEARDYLFDGASGRWFSEKRVSTANNHGTGCTYSAAIAAYLARGFEVDEAVKRAKRFVSKALKNALSLGEGPGPLNHFWAAPSADSEE